MKMKTFQADTMQEALMRVKEELGPDAVILKTKKLSLKETKGLREYIEVTAALEEELLVKPATFPQLDSQGAEILTPTAYDKLGRRQEILMDKKKSEDKIPDSSPVLEMLKLGLKDGLQEIKDLLKNEVGSEIRNGLQSSVEAPTREIQILKAEVVGLNESLNHLKRKIEIDSQILPEFEALYSLLLEKDLEAPIAADLLKRLEKLVPPAQRTDQEKLLRFCAKILQNRMKIFGDVLARPNRPAIVLLVGPTGVGKTTTIAKLASYYKWTQQKKVAIISSDCYRMGADEQLQLFGKTAEIPVVTVYDDADIEKSIQQFRDKDFIFFDTAGRSHRHQEMWEELEGVLHKVMPDEVHLCLSASMRTREMLYIYDKYQKLGLSALIFTKLDECLHLGSLANLALSRSAPISWLGDGQNIPENLKLATVEDLTEWVLYRDTTAPFSEKWGYA